MYIRIHTLQNLKWNTIIGLTSLADARCSAIMGQQLRSGTGHTQGDTSIWTGSHPVEGGRRMLTRVYRYKLSFTVSLFT